MLNIHSKMSQLRITTQRPSFSFRSGSPFLTEESIFIILKFGELKNMTLVKKAFRKEFCLKNPRQVPHLTQLQRMYDRFLTVAASQPSTPDLWLASLQTSQRKMTSRGSNSSSKTSPKLTLEMLLLN